MTTPQPFLQTIARQYAARYQDLSRFCFIFPGRRSGTFFIKYLNEAIGSRSMIAPQTLTITDFNYSMADRIPDNRFDLLFLLYRCYLRVMNMHPGAEDAIPFEQFRSWGETVISDFNDVDSHLVDPDEIFKNLKDFNEISTDFLTEEQREVMEQYFGVEMARNEQGRFWKSYDYTSPRKDGDCRKTDTKGHFLYLWQAMAPLYHSFNKALAEEGLAYDGAAARLALRNLKEGGAECLEPQKIVFVGFNVLTTVEWQIFATLQKMTTEIDGRTEAMADFVWDMTGDIMDDEYAAAVKFVRRGISRFPKPEWLDLSESDAGGIPERLKVVSAPSNSIQAKIVGEEVKKLHAELTQDVFDDARVAVVLPDEGLLLPLIHSLPTTMVEERETGERRLLKMGVNLTMGLPLRHTPVVSFVNLLRRLQTRLRNDRRHPVYYHEDVEALLAHPFTHVLVTSETVMKIAGYIQRHHLKYIPQEIFHRYGSRVEAIFTRIDPKGSVDTVIGYIDSLLDTVDRLHEPAPRAEETQGATFDTLTHTHIEAYRRALTRLRSACHKREIEPGMNTLFLLADRLVAGEKVMFEGEPLTGLQIMGMLETRSLDFDHIVIPSMNERIFPRRLHTRTFIPSSLRVAYGLPSTLTQESVMAYYFYRLICRAKSVTMVYDARNADNHIGDPSRFILQLQHLYARGRMKMVSTRFSLPQSQPPTIEVAKDETVMERLNLYRRRGDDAKYLSASSLQKYFACPLSFYFQYLNGVNLQEKPSEFMTSIDIGNVVHDTMMRLYLDDDEYEIILPSPQPVPKSVSEERINQLVVRAINEKFLHRKPYDAPLSGEPEIQRQMIVSLIKKIVELDATHTGLELLGVEIDKYLTVKVNSDLDVNFEIKIDRLDKFIEKGEEIYRVVDYKTGSVSADATDMDTLFDITMESKYLFQLMMYSTLARELPELRHIRRYRLTLYDVNGGKTVTPKFAYDPKAGYTHRHKVLFDTDNYFLEDLTTECGPLSADFRAELLTRLAELFDAAVPFRQTDDVSHCTFCQFRSICRR